ncbi:unnamed protein product [Gongylonema pulchrum]|uniref:Uncharacterized protein n=1 Tax=Gongylonema pulchrum TaxID=637853 RepID=A0A3P6PES6_9BILA|nr:unnamed protein product [Gongylonema pulchrum]
MHKTHDRTGYSSARCHLFPFIIRVVHIVFWFYNFIFLSSSPSSSSAAAVAPEDSASRDSAGSVPSDKSRPGSAPRATTPNSETENVEYTDLIKYYNRVFIARVETFVKKLQPGLAENGISLLSIPTVQCNRLSPQRNVNDHVTVSPMPAMPVSPIRPDLRTINMMVHNAARVIPQPYSNSHSNPFRNVSRP